MMTLAIVGWVAVAIVGSVGIHRMRVSSNWTLHVISLWLMSAFIVAWGLVGAKYLGP